MSLKIEDLSKGPKEAGLSRSQSDPVEWTAKYPGSKKAELGKYEDTACYYGILGYENSRLKGVEVLCRPYKRGAEPESRHEGRLSREDYRAAVKFFKAAGIFPQTSRASIRKDTGNLMCFPKRDWDRDTLYIALSHYRLIDTRPDLVWKMLRLWEHYEPQGLHPRQVFFYAIYNAQLGTGHYCFPAPKSLHQMLGPSLYLNTAISSRPRLLVGDQREGPYGEYLHTVANMEKLGFSITGHTHVAIKAAAILNTENTVFFGRRAGLKFLRDNFKQFKTE